MEQCKSVSLTTYQFLDFPLDKDLLLMLRIFIIYKELVVSPNLNLVKYKKLLLKLKAPHRIEFLKKILLKNMAIDRLGKRFCFLNLDLNVEEKYLDPLKQEKKYFTEWIHWDTPDIILRKEVKFQ